MTDEEILAQARVGLMDEVQSMLKQFEDTLLIMETDPHDKENLNAAFRAAHTIKGSAGLFGCEHVVHFTHEVETLLEELRAGRMALSEPLVALLLQSRDQMERLLPEVQELPLDDDVIEHSAELGRQLRAALGQALTPASPGGSAPVPAPATSRASFICNTRVPLTGGVRVWPRPLWRMSSPVPAAATSVPSRAGGSRCQASWGDWVSRISSACVQVATVEATAAVNAAWGGSSPWRALVPIEAMVAVLETTPPKMPVSTMPARSPKARSATWPAACITSSSSTSRVICLGLRPPRAGSGPGGISGRATRASAANIRPSCSSASVSTRVEKRCSCEREASTMASTTASPPPCSGATAHSTPIT